MPTELDKPLVSVIMNCYNGEKYLREAIDSVWAQTYNNWEIIFWDNASTDSSTVIAESYGPRIKCFKADKLEPLYTARNYAINHCCGEVIAFLDCDDIWLPDKLKRQVELFNKKGGIIYGGYENIDAIGNLTGSIVDEVLGNKQTNTLLIKNPISIGCVLIDSNVLKENKFDPSYDLLGDFELWVRLSLSYPIHSVGGVVEYSRQHSSNLSNTLKEKWLTERRNLYRKYLTPVSIIKYPALLRYIAKTELKGLTERA